jgi:GT2 family glycosyltransferase
VSQSAQDVRIGVHTKGSIARDASATMMTVGIVNYNTRADLERCLESLQDEPQAGVVVVDNGSMDGSVAMVQERFPWVRIEESGGNRGYGAGANRALEVCDTPFLLLLNSDVIVPRGAVAALARHLESRPETAVLGPRLLNADRSHQNSCYPFLTPLHWFLTATNFARFLSRVPVLRHRTVHGWAHDEMRSVDWVKGAALAMRRDAVLDIGGFDERFFMYWEEVDLCYRLRTRGWRIDFVAEPAVVHAEAASTRQRRAEMAVRQFRSALLFYRHHYSRSARMGLRATAAAVMLWRIGRDTVRERGAADRSGRKHYAENVQIWKKILGLCVRGR